MSVRLKLLGCSALVTIKELLDGLAVLNQLHNFDTLDRFELDLAGCERLPEQERFKSGMTLDAVVYQMKHPHCTSPAAVACTNSSVTNSSPLIVSLEKGTEASALRFVEM